MSINSEEVQLEQHLRQDLIEEQREQIEGELIKTEIALSFLDDPAKTPAGRQGKKAADRIAPPA